MPYILLAGDTSHQSTTPQTPLHPLKCIRNIADLDQLRGGAVTIGNFDGVHRGHREIIERLKSKAATHDGPAIVFTFDPHPVRLLRPDKAPPPLTWTGRKAHLLEEIGVDGLIAYPTSHDLLKLTPQEFFQQIIVDTLDVKAMVEGPNFFFGKERAGDINVLGKLCEQYSIDLEIVEALEEADSLISSSRVRTAIAEGDVAAARSMLTQPYRLRGMVTHGAARGGQIGFPTANLDAIDTLVPALGVYAGRAYVGNKSGKKPFPAAIHIGPNPTFGENAVKVEVHLLDFSDDLYGQPLEVDFLERLRGITKFDGIESLVAQLKIDVAAARKAQPQ